MQRHICDTRIVNRGTRKHLVNAQEQTWATGISFLHAHIDVNEYPHMNICKYVNTDERKPVRQTAWFWEGGLTCRN